jgi:hypothetical protein
VRETAFPQDRDVGRNRDSSEAKAVREAAFVEALELGVLPESDLREAAALRKAAPAQDLDGRRNRDLGQRNALRKREFLDFLERRVRIERHRKPGRPEKAESAEKIDRAGNRDVGKQNALGEGMGLQALERGIGAEFEFGEEAAPREGRFADDAD